MIRTTIDEDTRRPFGKGVGLLDRDVVRECPTRAGWRAKRLRRQVRRQNLL
jgi:hypothetical protein